MDQEQNALRRLDTPQALAEAVERYSPPLLRYCHGILCDYHEAQDALQTVFLKAYAKGGPAGGGPLQPWLYRIAYTTCIDLLRRRRFQLFPGAAPTRTAGDYIGEELRAALLALSPLDRALVWNRAVESCSYQELEEVYHKPAASLRKRYQRAKERLAKSLREEHPAYCREMEEKHREQTI